MGHYNGIYNAEEMIIGYILLIIAAAQILIVCTLIFRYQKKQATVYYGLFAIGIAIYVTGNGFGFTRLIETNLAESIAWVGGVLATTFFLVFSFTFPISKKQIADLLPLILWPVIVFIPNLFFTEAIIGKSLTEPFGEGYQTDTGPLFWLLLSFIGIYWIWGIGNLIKAYRQSDGFYRRFLKILSIGVTGTLIVTLAFDVVLPLFIKSQFGYVGSLFSSVWVIVTSYLMLKK